MSPAGGVEAFLGLPHTKEINLVSVIIRTIILFKVNGMKIQAVPLLLFLQLSRHANGCPALCQCFLGSKVVCTEEGMTTLPRNLSSHVRELLVVSSGLRSVAPLAFRGAGQLTKVALISSPLTAVSPAAFAGLPLLEELDISGHYNLEALEMGTLDQLGNLTSLLLNNNHLSKLESGLFDSLEKLEGLELRGNVLRWLPSVLFQHLHNLRRLDLSMNIISSMDEDLLNNLTSLRSLKLSHNLISVFPPRTFRRASQLKELSLQGNIISELHPGLFTHLTSLEELNLRGNKLMSVRAVVFPPSLRELDLQGNQLVQLALGTLPELTRLVLAQNRLLDLPEDLLKNLTALEHVDLSENRLRSLPGGLFSGLSRILSVHLNLNNLSSLDADLFRDQESLERLYLSENRLQTIPHGLFEGFHRTQSVMRLRGNPWNCDCGMLYLYGWLESGRTAVEDLSHVSCEGPAALSGQNLVHLERDQLVCPTSYMGRPSPAPAVPRTSNSTRSRCVLQESGGMLSISCTVPDCSQSQLRLEASVLGQDGRTTSYVLNKGADCVNATVTLTV
ncbi:carboxypeptidase N subunit 2-like [Denticeps clupeoides]|uniref:carboxypeptidase N subunit 2-like n=1 Tax=Denticeps clupeoides TaxID=299321 RepID=UPI0010A397DD|nr:carboxypeptidase N subunit 2-like [Denticeps clupeoides]